jgi:MFS family permease
VRRRLATSLRTLDPQLPRAVWILEAGTLLNFFGTGVAYPFLFIYLHNVRGFGLGTAGLVVSLIGVVALVVGPAAGPVLDRVGGRVTLAAALAVSALGFGLLPLAHLPWQAFLFAVPIGFGTGTFWPSISVLLTGLTPGDRRHHAFALQRVALNLGLGLGGLVGGLIARASDPTTFTVLFLVNAVSFLAMIVFLPLVPEPRLPEGLAPAAAAGYVQVLRDRIFVSIAGLNVVFIAAGYATFELLPVFAKNEAHVSERWIGLIFFVNTLALVVLQLPVARLLEGRRRMPALALMPVFFAAAWLVVLAGGAFLDGTQAALVFAAAAIVVGVGSCVQGPTQGALVADLAPPYLRGRYMALSAASWEIGFVVGPAAGGFILAASPLAVWPIAAALCAAAAVATLALDGRLPPDLRRTPGVARAQAGK